MMVALHLAPPHSHDPKQATVSSIRRIATMTGRGQQSHTHICNCMYKHSISQIHHWGGERHALAGVTEEISIRCQVREQEVTLPSWPLYPVIRAEGEKPGETPLIRPVKRLPVTSPKGHTTGWAGTPSSLHILISPVPCSSSSHILFIFSSLSSAHPSLGVCCCISDMCLKPGAVKTKSLKIEMCVKVCGPRV